MPVHRPDPTRRDFLRFLAASPLLAGSWPDWAGGAGLTGDGGQQALIDRADQALNVFDFEAVAEANLPPAHWGYIQTGVRDDATLRANREAFSKLKLRARRLVGVSDIDMSVELFGERWPTPIVIAPTGSQRGFHPEGEVAVARAARSRNHLMVLSNVATTSLEDAIEARGAPIWQQFYPPERWESTRRLLRRVEATGCPVAVLTVDLPAMSNRETELRYARMDTRDCTRCHGNNSGEDYFSRKPMYDGIDRADITEIGGGWMDWAFVDRFKAETSMRLVIKGIVTAEDARRSVDHGADAIVVSNHGGRAAESLRSTLESLPEVVEAVDGRIPVLVDSGFRRGMDILKGLALGATAVQIGRPYLWGLAAFGQEGVETVLDLLTAELEIAMKFAGARSIDEIERSMVEWA